MISYYQAKEEYNDVLQSCSKSIGATRAPPPLHSHTFDPWKPLETFWAFEEFPVVLC